MDMLTIVEKLVEHSVSLVAMLILIYWQRSDNQQKDKRDQQLYDNERSDKMVVLNVVEKNTHALTEVHGVCNRILTLIERLFHAKNNHVDIRNI